MTVNLRVDNRRRAAKGVWMGLDRYPPNPNYGGGALRRRIRLNAVPGMVTALLDDNHHAMQCRLEHAAGVVTGLEGEMVRAPMSTCVGARALLEELVGEPFGRTAMDLASNGRARRQCTHLFDLALLAYGFAAEEIARRQIDIVVPDAVEGRRTIRAWVDDKLVLSWTTEDDVIVDPEPWAGQGIHRGFVRRAMAMTTGVELDAALMAQKTVIVARGRSHIFDKEEGAPVHDAGEMLGACYSYSLEHYPRARQLAGQAIDFSSGVIETSDVFAAWDQAYRDPAKLAEEPHG